ncbi:hypothetical protein J6253_07605 [bacterium]|nr:hypothetical protein [bacterium]MBP5590612.1 hypothetical protein [bacterium]
MKDTSLLEKILSKFLSHEQIVALTEEISKGVSVVNGVIDKNEKVKAKKEFVLETFRSVDRMIAQSNKIPATFKLFYDTAKIKIHDLLEPIISGMVMENDFSDLDDIPDVNKTDSFQKPENNERTQGNPNNNQQQNGGEQGSRRRRRRHGRNRNNNHNAETFSETAPVKPEPKPEPVQTFHETSLPNESKPKPAKRGRTPKKNDAKPESEPKPETPQTNETPAAKKPARRGRTPRKPKETNE